MKRAALTVLSALSLAGGLKAEFSMPFDGRLHLANGSNPNRRAEDNLRSSGAEVGAFFTPLWSFGRGAKFYLSGAYDFEYSNVNNVIRVDETLFQFVQQMNNTIEAGGGWRNESGGKIAVKGFGEFFNGKEALDDEWLRGPYDYRDRGGRVTWTQDHKGGTPWQWNLGYKFTDRLYANYVSLDEQRRREKDQVINKVFFDGDVNWKTAHPFSTFFSYSLQSITYAEALVIDESGTTVTASGVGTLRRDMVHTFTMDFPFDFGANHYSLGYSAEIRDSNHNFFDSQEFVYIPDDLDSGEHGLSFSYAHDFASHWWVLDAPQFTFDFSGKAKLYKELLARDKEGKYTSVKQVDNTFNVEIGLNSPVSEHWAFDMSFAWLTLGSNNKDASISLNNYTFLTTRIGTKFAY